MLAIIRIRGEINLSPRIKKTLDLLGLRNVNTCVLVSERNESRKMVDIVKDYVAFGEINEWTTEKLLEKRGRMVGNKKVSETVLKENDCVSFKELSKKIIEKNVGLKNFAGLKPFFRLTPPKKGFERGGIKKAWQAGGALGYRGNEINELLLRMI